MIIILFSSNLNLILLFSVRVTLFQGKTSHGIKWWRKHVHMTVSLWCQMILCISYTHLVPQGTQRYNVHDSLDEEKFSKQFLIYSYQVDMFSAEAWKAFV